MVLPVVCLTLLVAIENLFNQLQKIPSVSRIEGGNVDDGDSIQDYMTKEASSVANAT